MKRHLVSLILVVAGGFGTGLSWWLLLHLSDKRLLGLIRPRWNPKMSQEDTETYRTMNIAWLAIVLMVMASIIMIAGIMRLFGYG